MKQKVKQLSPFVGGLRWTRRLHRFGGLRNLLIVRHRQMALVAEVMKHPHRNHAALKFDIEFLNGHPLRTLPLSVERRWRNSINRKAK